jgi:hypothetical protein
MVNGGQKNDRFLGRGVKNKLDGQKYTPFLGRGPGYLLYLHDLDFSARFARSK